MTPWPKRILCGHEQETGRTTIRTATSVRNSRWDLAMHNHGLTVLSAKGCYGGLLARANFVLSR